MGEKQDANFIVSGHGKVNAEVIAVGYKADARKIVTSTGEKLENKGLAELRLKLDTLLNALDQHCNEITDLKSVFDLTSHVAGELAHDKPNKSALKSLLSTIAEETKSIGDIAAAALSLKELIGIFL